METRQAHRERLNHRRRERHRWTLRWLILAACLVIVLLGVLFAVRGCGSAGAGEGARLLLHAWA